MEVTYKTRGIILRREPYGEDDSRVFIYTPDFGKLDLIARGTQKLSSKLAAHIEPLNLCEIMIVRGKQYDYLGSIVSEDVFFNIKNNYDKMATAGEIVKLVNDAIKEKQTEPEIFLLLREFLDFINVIEGEQALVCFQILKSAFILKFLALLGYAPNLDNLELGDFKISQNIADLIKILQNKNFDEIARLNFEPNKIKEFSDAIGRYKIYLFD
jgi:DNA repair protein RecO (recombination protein O)